MGKKIKGRELLKACVIRKYKFDNQTYFKLFQRELERKGITHYIAEYSYNDDGTIIVYILTPYNNTPILEYL